MPCFPAKQAKAVLKEVKALADALGERRDADVAIATLDSFAAAMPSPDRRGIESLVEEFRDEQLAANADLAAPVEAARIDALQRSRSRPRDGGAPGSGDRAGAGCGARRRRRVKARKVKRLDPAGTLAENAARIVLVRLDELRGFAAEALEPDASATQHDMRIAAKRLRYVLEATGFCFGRPAETARRRAKDLQDLLGEIHDCDVMLPRVDRPPALAAARRRRRGSRPRRRRPRPRSEARGPGAAPDRLPGPRRPRGLSAGPPRACSSTASPSYWAETEQRGVWRRWSAPPSGRSPAPRRCAAPPPGLERAREELAEAERRRIVAAEQAERAAADLAEAEAEAG